MAARHGCEAVKIVGHATGRARYLAACIVYQDTPAVAQEGASSRTTDADAEAYATV